MLCVGSIVWFIRRRYVDLFWHVRFGKPHHKAKQGWMYQVRRGANHLKRQQRKKRKYKLVAKHITAISFDLKTKYTKVPPILALQRTLPAGYDNTMASSPPVKHQLPSCDTPYSLIRYDMYCRRQKNETQASLVSRILWHIYRDITSWCHVVPVDHTHTWSLWIIH